MALAAKKRVLVAPSATWSGEGRAPKQQGADEGDDAAEPDSPLLRVAERGSAGPPFFGRGGECERETRRSFSLALLRLLAMARGQHPPLWCCVQVFLSLALAGALGFLLTVNFLFVVDVVPSGAESLLPSRSSNGGAAIKGRGSVAVHPAPVPLDDARYTVRVNTFRRNDLLQRSVDHFARCAGVHEIQVVWSDPANAPPPETLFAAASRPLVKFEVHEEDSLSNRFLPPSPPPTEAVFSVDDDLIISCADVAHAFEVWRGARRAMVGFVPRLVTWDSLKGRYDYRSWWVTWWNGLYNVILTKACFLRRDHLEAYAHNLPRAARDLIDARRNCEDLAMSFVVAKNTAAPPVWVSGRLTETAGSGGGISTARGHFRERGDCATFLAEQLGGFPLVLASAKAVPARSLWFWW